MRGRTWKSKSTPGLRAQIVEVGARWATKQRELIQLVVALDDSGEWVLDRAPACAHWVAAALDIEVCTAREWLRIGRALAEVDVVDGAFAAGRLSYSKVRTLTRVATVDSQVELCALAEQVPAGRLGCALAAWRARRETPAETEARQRAARGLTARVDVDGMVVTTLRHTPEESAELRAAIDACVRGRRPDASADASAYGRWPSLAQQRADALLELVRGGGANVVAEVVLHVRGDGCTLDDGTPITETVVERIAPQAFLRALIHDAESRPINASGRRRHPTARQRRVVKERDRACVDCGATDFLEYDHQPPFEESEQTVASELKLRCCVCHDRRHRRGRGRAG
jgi:hypothetical protein